MKGTCTAPSMRSIVSILALSGFLALGCGKPAPATASSKFLIVLQADTDRHEGLARALHALLYAKELKEGG